MENYKVDFTVSSDEGDIFVDLRYTCRSQEELICARGAIVDYLNTLYDKWDKEERQNAGSTLCPEDKAKLINTIDFAIERAKKLKDQGQHSYAEGLINAAKIAGVLSEEEYHRVYDHWDSVKGFLYKDEGPEE